MTANVNGANPSNSTLIIASQARSGFDRRLLAEAVRLHEEALGHPLNEPQAESAAREADGSLEQRIIARAQSLSIAPSLQEALHQLRSAFAAAILIGMILAVIAGATTAQVALGAEAHEPVNFFWVLGTILGINTLALILWLVLIFVQPGTATTGSLGAVAFALGRRLNYWLHKGPISGAVVQAFGSVYARSPLGRWTLSAVSHTLWLGFLIGSLVLVLLILSTKEYHFAWETTILSDRTYVALTRTLASAPEALGFTTPDAEQIAASRWAGVDNFSQEIEEAWSGLLVGSIVTYGILPRALLLLLSIALRGWAGWRFRLDTNRPGYSRLRNRLMPSSKNIGIIDADIAPEAAHAKEASTEEAHAVQASGPVAILGLEIDPPQAGWPPPLEGIDWLDLGLVDSRKQRRQTVESICSASEKPRLIVVVCSLTATPDRGTRAFINDLHHTSHIPVVLLLTEGQRLRNRGSGEQVTQRIDDWRQVAAEAQVEHNNIAEVDLDHLTELSRAKLAKLMGANPNARLAPRRIEKAFTLILEHVHSWTGTPSANEQAELHRKLAQLYRGEQQSWQTLLQAKVKEGGNQTTQLRTSASRMVSLLPDRLRRSSKWLAAGALAGAMGCVAASTLLAPATIVALPAWAGLGAAVSAALQPLMPERAKEEGLLEKIDLTEAVNSAALFAVLLELQGRDEAAITQIMDRVAAEDEPPIIADSGAARAWLDTLRHRLDLALATEGIR
jgi:hypothetical protein